MRGYVEFNLSQRCFGPAQFEATLLRQTYLRKIVSSRQKEKENVSPFLFSFVFHRSLSTVNRDESVDRLCTNENVGQRHRIDVSPRFSSSFNKIHSWELHVLSRNFDSRLSKIFASFYKTRTRVTTHLSFSLSFPFLFLEKIGNNRLRPIILFKIVFSSFQNKKERVWWSFEILVSGHEIFLFFSPPLLMPSIIEKSMTMMMKNRGISKRRFPFYSSLFPFAN